MNRIKILFTQTILTICLVLYYIKAKIFGDFKPKHGLISHYGDTAELNEARFLTLSFLIIAGIATEPTEEALQSSSRKTTSPGLATRTEKQ